MKKLFQQALMWLRRLHKDDHKDDREWICSWCPASLGLATRREVRRNRCARCGRKLQAQPAGWYQESMGPGFPLSVPELRDQVRDLR